MSSWIKIVVRFKFHWFIFLVLIVCPDFFSIALSRRCASRLEQSECVMYRVIFALGKSRFQRCMWWNFAFFEVCVGNFDTIPPWKVVGTLCLDSSDVTFKCFAFLSGCDKFELFGHVQAAMMIWVLFLPFFLDSLLVTVSGHLVASVFLLCKFRGLPGSTSNSFPAMRRWKCLGMKRSSQPSSITPGKRAKKTCRSGNWREASNAKSWKSLFHFRPEKVNKFDYCNNLSKQNIFRNPVRKLKACL